MKIYPASIPQGTRTYLFEEASHKRYIEQTIHAVLRARGFQEIVTTQIEYYESAITGLSEAERNRLIRFTEGDSGRIMSLRADITSQVARSAATHLAKRPMPLKLCYSGPVFRRARKGKGEQYVLHQSGLEILGHAGPEADVEAIFGIVSALKKVTLEKFSFSIGHAGVVAAFLEGLDIADMESLKLALGKKDKGALKKILGENKISGKKADNIIALTELYGSKETLEKASKLCESEGSKKALENLEAIYGALESAGLAEQVNIDLGEMRGFGYYTGMVMELYSGSGMVIGRGGRYDNLVKRFGLDIPAIGFAFDIDQMIEAIHKESNAPVWQVSDMLLLGGDEETAEKIRSGGLMVTMPLQTMSDADAESYAEKMNIPHLLKKLSAEEFEWTERKTGKKEKCSLNDFLDRFYK